MPVSFAQMVEAFSIHVVHDVELLRDAPIEILTPSAETEAILSRWGIRTFGQLAALPELALSERLGQEGIRLQRLAQGLSTRILSPTSAPAIFEEEIDLDDPVIRPQPSGFGR